MKSNLVDSIWTLKPVAELVDIYIGGTPSRRVGEYWGSDVNWASAADVASCRTRYLRETTEKISIVGLENSSAKLLEEDTVLITARGTVGALCMLPEPMAFNQTCYGLVSKGEIDPTFLYFTLRARIAHIKTQTYGAVFDTITTTSFDNILIPLPPFDIQQRIAFVLSNYDELIENNNYRIDILEKMTRAIYHEWFIHFRFPSHEEVEMIKSEDRKIPEGWEITKLKDVMELRYGKGLREKDRIDGEFPVYGSSGVIDYHRESLVDGPGIIVGRKGNPGKVHWAHIDFYPIDTTFYVSTDLSLFYAYYHLDEMEFTDTHTAVPGLSRDSAYLKDFLVPSPEYLSQFDEIAAPVFTLKYNLELQNIALQEMQNLLLPKLVSGQIDVSDIEIPTDNHQTSKYSDQSTLDQWLDGDEDHDPS